MDIFNSDYVTCKIFNHNMTVDHINRKKDDNTEWNPGWAGNKTFHSKRSTCLSIRYTWKFYQKMEYYKRSGSYFKIKS